MPKQLTTGEELDLFNHWIKEGTPFFHTRYNDGELSCLFDLRAPEKTASGEHHYSREVSVAIKKTFKEVLLAATSTSQRSKVVIGSYWLDPWVPQFVKKQSDRLSELIQRTPDSLRVQWGPSDLWYSTPLEEKEAHEGVRLILLINTLRWVGNRSMPHRPVVLVGNSYIAGARHCLGASFIEIPKVDAWKQDDDIRPLCLSKVVDGAIFVWCAGFPGKVWSWECFKSNPNTTHIDAGHLFDLAYGPGNREWSNRKTGTHCRYYLETLKPYILSFEPKV